MFQNLKAWALIGAAGIGMGRPGTAAAQEAPANAPKEAGATDGPTPSEARPDEAPSPAAGPKTERPQLVVTATREPAEALQVPAHVTVLDAEDLDRATWRDVADALAVQPGLFARRNGVTPQDITIDARGFNNGGGNGQRLLVLVDGRKTNAVATAATDWAAIPMENVERIEIVRGPAAALYGDTAVAGVVHIITKDGGEAAVRQLAADAGSFGTLRERLFLSGGEGDLTYALFAKNERSDGFRENSAYEGKDHTLKLGCALGGDWRLRAKIGAHDDTRDRPGTLTQGEAAVFGRDASVTPGDESSVFSSNGDLGIERRRERFMKGAGTVEERSSAFFTWGHARNDSLVTFVGGGSTASKDDSDLLNLTLQHTSLFELLDPDAADLKVTAGADLGYETADATSFNDFAPFFIQDQDTNYRRRLMGLFAHGELSATESLLVSGGARFDRALFGFNQHTSDLVLGGATDADGAKAFDQWNPHLGATYRWSGSTSTYVAWGRTMRYPNRDELLGFLTAAPELRPERAATWDAGFREEWRDFTGTLSAFRMDVQDEIFFVPPPAGAFTFGSNQNVAHIRHQGIESGFRWQAADPLALTGGYTFTRTTMETGAFDRHQLPLTPRNQGALGTHVNVGKGWTLSTQTRFVGKRLLLNDLDNTTRGLPSYAVTDVELRCRWGRAQAWVTAFNVADREVYDNGGIGGFPHGSREAFNPAPGASFEAGMQVEF